MCAYYNRRWDTQALFPATGPTKLTARPFSVKWKLEASSVRNPARSSKDWWWLTLVSIKESNRCLLVKLGQLKHWSLSQTFNFPFKHVIWATMSFQGRKTVNMKMQTKTNRKKTTHVKIEIKDKRRDKNQSETTKNPALFKKKREKFQLWKKERLLKKIITKYGNRNENLSGRGWEIKVEELRE